MQAGELIVIESGKVSITLDSHPSKIIAHFKDDWKMIPCNPQHYEGISYKIVLTPINGVNVFQLELSWQVSGVRNIYWEAYY